LSDEKVCGETVRDLGPDCGYQKRHNKCVVFSF